MPHAFLTRCLGIGMLMAPLLGCGGGGSQPPEPDPGSSIQLQQTSAALFSTVLVGDLPSKRGLARVAAVDPTLPPPGRIRLWDPSGFDIDLPLLTLTPITFLCPPLLNPADGSLRAGSVSLSVRVASVDYTVTGLLSIQTLGIHTAPPGTFATQAAEAFSAIAPTLGQDILDILTNLDGAQVVDKGAASTAGGKLAAGWAALAASFRSLMDGTVAEVSFGTWSDGVTELPLILGAQHLAALDDLSRMLHATLDPLAVQNESAFLLELPLSVSRPAFRDPNALLRLGAAGVSLAAILDWLRTSPVGAPLTLSGEQPGRSAWGVAVAGVIVVAIVLLYNLGAFETTVAPAIDKVLWPVSTDTPTEQQNEDVHSVLSGPMWTDYLAGVRDFWSSVRPPEGCAGATPAKQGDLARLVPTSAASSIAVTCEVHAMGAEAPQTVSALGSFGAAIFSGQIQPYPWALGAGMYTGTETPKRFGSTPPCWGEYLTDEAVSIRFRPNGGAEWGYRSRTTYVAECDVMGQPAPPNGSYSFDYSSNSPPSIVNGTTYVWGGGQSSFVEIYQQFDGRWRMHWGWQLSYGTSLVR